MKKFSNRRNSKGDEQILRKKKTSKKTQDIGKKFKIFEGKEKILKW